MDKIAAIDEELEQSIKKNMNAIMEIWELHHDRRILSKT